VRHLRELLIDAWSWLNYKQAMADPNRAGHHAFPELNTSWVPAEEMRRLAAYKLLAAYDSNQAGQLAAVTGDHHGVELRELGDPSKLIDTTLGYLLGAEQTIVVPGADHAGQDKPTAKDRAAADLQEKLRAWADKELLALRIQQAERCAVRSGDGVYTLAWEPSKRRALLRTLMAISWWVIPVSCGVPMGVDRPRSSGPRGSKYVSRMPSYSRKGWRRRRSHGVTGLAEVVVGEGGRHHHCDHQAQHVNGQTAPAAWHSSCRLPSGRIRGHPGGQISADSGKGVRQ
jgi:hypothetical protein